MPVPAGARRATLLAVLLVAAALAFAARPVVARAAVTLSGRSPAPGSIVTAPGTLSLQITADESANAFTNTSSRLYLDGSELVTYQDYPIGHVLDPGCDETWVVDDWTVMTLVAWGTIPDGPHTVRAVFRDDLGNTTEDTWSFTVAQPPTAWAFFPTVGTASRTPTISAQVTDNGPGYPTVNMYVDGTPVASTYSTSTHIVTYKPVTPLTNAADHTVQLLMTDSGGRTSNASWTFRVQESAILFSSHTPLPGSLVSGASAAISVQVSSANTLRRTLTGLTCDYSNAYPSIVPYSDSTAFTITANLWGLRDGVHLLRAYTTDTYGGSAETTWAFVTAQPPSVYGQVPAPGGTTDLARPVIQFLTWDNSPGWQSVRMTVDGVLVRDVTTPQGVAVSWQPSVYYENGSVHTVQVQVTDTAGNVANASWSFTCVAKAPMSSVCDDCHRPFHPTDNCYACHGGDYHSGSCSGCHDGDGHGPEYISSDCGICHGVNPATGPLHTPASEAAAHLTSTTGSCFGPGCHLTALDAEHGRYPSGSDLKFQCTICHSSADPRVVAAIAGDDSSCGACHDTTGHEAAHADGFTAGADCAGCHDANLVTEHLTNRGFTCDTCHASADGTVQAAVIGGDRMCDACHAGALAGHTALHESHGAAGECASCHRPASGQHDGSAACSACHIDLYGDDPLLAQAIGKGPHGVYSSSSDRCGACHTLHRAPDGTKLLPAQSITQSCYSCHDGTGGTGVYGALASRGASAAASHSIDATSVVPGGDGATGGAATMTFRGGAGGTLGCSDCHSPHDANTVAPWTSQRWRTGVDRRGGQGVTRSNRLLRANPGGSTATATVYGSDWCLACHAGRASGGAVHNHPVDSVATTASPSFYEGVARLDSDESTTGTTVVGTLAKTNAGFLMPWPRTPQQEGHLPICQQCHENSRNKALGGVGSLDATAGVARATAFSSTATDSLVATDNPQFLSFPHETVNRGFLVETGDDLCLNCHPSSQLKK